MACICKSIFFSPRSWQQKEAKCMQSSLWINIVFPGLPYRTQVRSCLETRGFPLPIGCTCKGYAQQGWVFPCNCIKKKNRQSCIQQVLKTQTRGWRASHDPSHIFTRKCTLSATLTGMILWAGTVKQPKMEASGRTITQNRRSFVYP